MIKLVFAILLLILFSISCIVKSPKYTTIDRVLTLKLGMSKEQVEEILGLQPYDLGSYNDSSDIFRYVYRVNERRTISFNTKPDNGKKMLGKYVQLSVTYSKEGKATNIESCIDCNDVLISTSRIDIEKAIIFLTITLPVLLVYIGLK